MLDLQKQFYRHKLCYNTGLVVKDSRGFSLITVIVLIIAFTLSSTAQALILPTQKQDIVSELIALKSKDSRLNKEVKQLDEKLTNTDNNLKTLNSRIIDAEFKLSQELKILSKRIKAIYKENRHHTSLQIILSSESIYEFLTKVDFVGLIIKQDAKLIKQSKENKSKLVNLKNEYISKRKKIVALKEAKQRTVSESKIIKSELVKKLKIIDEQQKAQIAEGLDIAKFYDEYLGSKNSPMTGLGGTIVAASKTFNVNPSLIVSIAGVESSFGINNAGAYNAWGRKSKSGGYASFESWDASVYNQAEYLRDKYFNQGLKTTVSIGSKYAPGNNRWPGKVEHFLNDINEFGKANG